MKFRHLIAAFLAVALLAAGFAWWMTRPPAPCAPPSPSDVAETVPVPEPHSPGNVTRRQEPPPPIAPTSPAQPTVADIAPAPTKLERLERIRQTFTQLAAGDPRAALAAARNLEDETERETALMTI